MCMSIPGKVISIKKRVATIETSGEKIEIDLGLNDDIGVNDFVLYASNRLVRKISKEDATKIDDVLSVN